MERVFLRPPGKLDLTVRVPGSKSLTNRALVAAALADGSSTLRGISLSDDSRYLADALRKSGVSVAVKDETCVVEGGRIGPVSGAVMMGNAGAALRFFLSLACLGEGTYVVDGDERMRERPIQGLVDTLVQLGAEARSTNGFPPVTIEGARYCRRN